MNANATEAYRNDGIQVGAVPRYMTSDQAASHLVLSEATLRNWRSAGQGPAYVKVGRSVRYMTTDLDGWMGAQRVEPQHV